MASINSAVAINNNNKNNNNNNNNKNAALIPTFKKIKKNDFSIFGHFRSNALSVDDTTTFVRITANKKIPTTTTTTTTSITTKSTSTTTTSKKNNNKNFKFETRLRSILQATIFAFLVFSLSSLVAIAATVIEQQQQQQQPTAIEDPDVGLQSYVFETEFEHGIQLTETPELSNSSVLYLLAAIGSNSNGTANSSSTHSNLNNGIMAGGGDGVGGGVIAFATSIYDPLSSDTSTNVNITPVETEMDSNFAIPPLHAIIISIVLLFVIIGTIVGNILVCIAVCMVRKLRRPCNYLLVSLALSDLCVAVLVMPMALTLEVLDKWNFGILLCDIWVAFDVLCCTASILNLCAISVDRYLAITKPLEYGVKRTPRRMMACVALVWLAAACISLPPLLILGNEHQDENGNPICTVCQNFAYQIYATLGSFYIPLSVMLFVYYQIFRAARRIVLEEKRAQTHLQHALNGTASSPPPGQTDLSVGGGGGGGCGGGNSGNGQQQGQQHRNSSYGNTSLNYSTCGGLSVGHGSGGGVSGSSNLLGSPHQKKLRFQLAKEKKASTTLGIIMSAFTICWLPFFILALIRPFVESETVHVPQSLSSLFLWLGYANSLLNPIIYATLNRDFRKPFQEILYFRCSSLNTMMRENYYQDQYGEPPSQRVMLGDERHGARESFL